MGRSGYSEDWDGDELPPELYRNSVDRAIAGRRGQAFLQFLAKEMDMMPDKALVAGDLVTPEGDCCAIGVVCKARNIDVTDIDETDREAVAALVNIAPAMAAEIAYENDQDFSYTQETPEQRWTRMRKWVDSNLQKSK